MYIAKPMGYTGNMKNPVDPKEQYENLMKNVAFYSPVLTYELRWVVKARVDEAIIEGKELERMLNSSTHDYR